MWKLLVVLDDLCECLNVICFVVMCVVKIGGGVQVLVVIFMNEIFYGMGVVDVMCVEVYECIQVYFEVFVKWMCDCFGVELELVVCEGELGNELLVQINDDLEIGIVVLVVLIDSVGFGLLVLCLMWEMFSLFCLIIIVLGDMLCEWLEQII